VPYIALIPLIVYFSTTSDCRYINEDSKAYHDHIPLITSRIAAHKSDAHGLIEQHILAIAELIAKLDLTAFESIQVLIFPWSISEQS
jgi:hypothetical protein